MWSNVAIFWRTSTSVTSCISCSRPPSIYTRAMSSTATKRFLPRRSISYIRPNYSQSRSKILRRISCLRPKEEDLCKNQWTLLLSQNRIDIAHLLFFSWDIKVHIMTSLWCQGFAFLRLCVKCFGCLTSRILISGINFDCYVYDGLNIPLFYHR